MPADRPRVAFLGLGTMGAPMALNLSRAGFPLTVWNRSPELARPFASLGVALAESPRAAAAESDVVITMLTGAEALDHVLFGADGAARAEIRDKLFVDCSTAGPRAARSIAARLADSRAEFIDAPLSGT